MKSKLKEYWYLIRFHVVKQGFKKFIGYKNGGKVKQCLKNWADLLIVLYPF